ncbi:enamine deaminase RidA [Vibrio zhanjiangensis]|uniref:Enamine deaminase RidA n=1 Tax=Vibrio zhanjiangensis TaxID=1046128 RepID=A0ABQ6EWW3_9VIBR|nr:RidA family protein [Vibrio zhanjiangensis]GLT17000.1 enamine deaminase RidA [Vibrio zhanjiangensis]
MIQKCSYDFLPVIAGPYVHATKHNQTLYISGLTAFGTDVQCGELSKQTEEVLSQLLKILDYEACSVSDLIKVTIFVTDITQLSSIRQQLFDVYQNHLPACSLVEVSALIHSDLKIEIEAIAALNSNGGHQ